MKISSENVKMIGQMAANASKELANGSMTKAEYDGFMKNIAKVLASDEDLHDWIAM